MSVSALPRPATIPIKEAAERLDVHENTIRNWVDQRLIGGYRTPTGRRKVLLSEVERLERETYGSVLAPRELKANDQVPPQAGQLERAGTQR